jgi:hypothetical protein
MQPVFVLPYAPLFDPYSFFPLKIGLSPGEQYFKSRARTAGACSLAPEWHSSLEYVRETKRWGYA